MKTSENLVWKQYSVSVSLKMFAVVFSFLNSILINRCLGVALRGEYTSIINIASLLQLILNLGIGNAYPNFKRNNPNEAKRIFSSLMYLQVFLYTIMAIPLLMFVPTMYKYIIILAIITILENQILFVAIVENIILKNKYYFITTVLYFINLLFVYLTFNNQIFSVMVATILNHLIVIVGLAWLFRINHFKLSIFDKKEVTKILKISLPTMVMSLLIYVNYHVDILFLNYMTKDYYVIGLYGTAVTLGNMLWIIPDAFKDVIYNRSVRNNNYGEVCICIFANVIICLVFLIGFIFLGKFFLEIAYGKEFVQAYPLVLLLFVGTFPMILYKLIHPLYVSRGQTDVVVKLLGLAAVCNIIGNIILIPKFSAYGAAISSVISYSICGVLFSLSFIKDFDISIANIGKLIKKRMNSIYERNNKK